MAELTGTFELPCGSWPSPLDAQSLARASLRLASPGFAPDGGLLWVEGRPSEGGRSVLVRSPATDGPAASDAALDLTPTPFDVRSRVHEYGGGAYAVLGDLIVFVDGKTSAVYQLRVGEAPQVLTAPGANWRFGDLTADPGPGPRAGGGRTSHAG